MSRILTYAYEVLLAGVKVNFFQYEVAQLDLHSLEPLKQQFIRDMESELDLSRYRRESVPENRYIIGIGICCGLEENVSNCSMS